MPEVSDLDKENLKRIRNNVRDFTKGCAIKFDAPSKIVLDIAPQDHEGAQPYFTKSKVETLDIDQNSGATYIADLCTDNSSLIKSSSFDYILCTEVLEHTLQPFKAVKEMKRILKSNGYVFVSTPFNFRIHGPLPDCWRFTEHGLRALFSEFKIVELNSLESKDRFLMPVHYTLVAKKV